MRYISSNTLPEANRIVTIQPTAGIQFMTCAKDSFIENCHYIVRENKISFQKKRENLS